MYSMKFQEHGLEVFKTPIPNSQNLRGAKVVESNEGRLAQVLQMREVNERIRSTFYTLQESEPAAALAFVNALLTEVNALLNQHLLLLEISASVLPNLPDNPVSTSISLPVGILPLYQLDFRIVMLIHIQLLNTFYNVNSFSISSIPASRTKFLQLTTLYLDI